MDTIASSVYNTNLALLWVAIQLELVLATPLTNCVSSATLLKYFLMLLGPEEHLDHRYRSANFLIHILSMCAKKIFFLNLKNFFFLKRWFPEPPLATPLGIKLCVAMGIYNET